MKTMVSAYKAGFMIALLGVFIAGCSGGGGGGSSSPTGTDTGAITGTDTGTNTGTGAPTIAGTVYPAVVSKSTDGSSCAVDTGGVISVTFNKDMNASTITAANFTVSGASGAVAYDSSAKKATFTPSSALAYDTAYTATITTSVKDTAGNAMANNFSWSFTTKQDPAAAAVPPYVTPYLMGGAIQGNPLSPFAGIVTTIAGTAGSHGSADGTGPAARFLYPRGITTDGTNLYVADTFNNIIRKIVISTGAVTTIAGTAAGFSNPNGITTDGTNLYVADTNNATIRKIVISTGDVTTIAGTGSAGSMDGTGTAASFHGPNGITTDGTNLYVADSDNNTIRKIVISTGVVTTIAGPAGFSYPCGITTDGINLYVADTVNYTIRKIVIATGVVTTIAGTAGSPGSADGTGPAASFLHHRGITTDGTNLYVADTNNYTIRKIVISTGVVTTIAGTAGSYGSTDGKGPAARFDVPLGITTDGTNLYVADSDNSTIRKIGAITPAPSSSPANIIAGAGNGQITLTWDSVSGANCYNLYCAAGTSVTNITGTAIASVASPYTYTGLANGTTYACIAMACNNTGEGPASSQISATPTASHTLSVSKSGTGSGAVSSSPAGIDCGSTCAASVTNGATVTLTATAASGSTFSGWSGGGCSGTGSCTAMLDSDKAVTATFTALPPPSTGTGTGGTYYWANWSCGSSSQCASVMGGYTGSTGLFCTVNDCNAWKNINFAGASCSTTATYTKRESTGSNGLCNQSGVDF